MFGDPFGHRLLSLGPALRLHAVFINISRHLSPKGFPVVPRRSAPSARISSRSCGILIRIRSVLLMIEPLTPDVDRSNFDEVTAAPVRLWRPRNRKVLGSFRLIRCTEDYVVLFALLEPRCFDRCPGANVVTARRWVQALDPVCTSGSAAMIVLNSLSTHQKGAPRTSARSARASRTEVQGGNCPIGVLKASDTRASKRTPGFRILSVSNQIGSSSLAPPSDNHTRCELCGHPTQRTPMARKWDRAARRRPIGRQCLGPGLPS